MEKLLKSINNILKRYGKVNTYHSLLIMIIISIIGVFLNNQNTIINKYIEYSQIEHTAGLEYRRKINPQISNSLSRLLIDTQATTISLCELHNGESNSANGLPFLKFSMLYEEPGPNVKMVSNYYEKVNTSNYKVLIQVFKGGVQCYDVDQDLRTVDPRLYFDLVGFGIKRIYFCPVYDGEKELGFVTMSFKNVDGIDDEYVTDKMFISSQKISALLNGYKK